MARITKAEELYSNANTFGTISPQRYRYSFSGADARMLVWFPQRPDLMNYLNSAHTLSVSVHEAKSQVRSLGYRGAKGITRSVRTIAGSLILTVVNDHPLRPLLDQFSDLVLDQGLDARSLLGWSADMDSVGVGAYNDIYSFDNRLCSLIPPFNIMVEFVSEASPVTYDATDNGSRVDTAAGPRIETGQRKLFPGAGLMLEGVELVDEGFVVSVNDMVTEITCSYVARDFKPISGQILHSGGAALTSTDMSNRALELFNKCYPEQPRLGSGSAFGASQSAEFEQEK